MLRAIAEDMFELLCLIAFLAGLALLAQPASAGWLG